MGSAAAARGEALPGTAPAFEIVGENFVLTSTALLINGTPSFAETEACAARLSVAEHGRQFGIGDMANFAEKAFGEKASQFLDQELFEEASLKVYRWVAEKVLPENRVAGLSFQHHKIVGALSPQEQRSWLRKALEGDGTRPWTSHKLADAMHGDPDTVTAFWLVVRCGDERDRAELRRQMESKGRICKDVDKKEREKKEVTARPKKHGKRRRGPK